MTESIQNRITGLVYHKGKDLEPHPMNWRRHPDHQRRALKATLERVGIADALIGYVSEEAGGKIRIIDGHMRKEEFPEQEWPVIMTDLDDAEARVLLAAHDRITLLAEEDMESIAALLEVIEQEQGDIVGSGYTISDLEDILGPPDEIDDPRAEWVGMPDCENEELGAKRQILVSFDDLSQVEEFSRRLDVPITSKTKAVWFPHKPTRRSVGHVVYD